MHGEDVPAVASEGLGEVDVLLVSGEAVEQDDGWVRLCAGGEKEETHDLTAVRVDDGFDVLRGRGGVRLGVAGNGVGLLRWCGVRQEGGAGEEQSQGRKFESAHQQQVSGRVRPTTIRCVRIIRRRWVEALAIVLVGDVVEDERVGGAP